MPRYSLKKEFFLEQPPLPLLPMKGTPGVKVTYTHACVWTRSDTAAVPPALDPGGHLLRLLRVKVLHPRRSWRRAVPLGQRCQRSLHSLFFYVLLLAVFAHVLWICGLTSTEKQTNTVSHPAWTTEGTCAPIVQTSTLQLNRKHENK